MSRLPGQHDGHKYDLLNDINSPIFVMDKEATFHFFNNAFEEFFGFKDLRHIEHSSEAKSLILHTLVQRCLQSKPSIFTVKISKYIKDAKKDLVFQVHKLVMHDAQHAFNGCIGIIQLIGGVFGDTAPLTKMELCILDLMAKGYGKKEISNLLGSSGHTIANHQKSIYKKLSAHTKITAINEGKKRGLLSD